MEPALVASGGVAPAPTSISWRLDADAAKRIRLELGLNPISWCETPSPEGDGALIQASGCDNRVMAMFGYAPSGGRHGVRPKARRSPKKGALRRRNEPWSELSTELILHIFKQLAQHDIATCARVCKFWYSLAYDETLWRKMVFSNRRVAPASIFYAINRNPRWLQITNCDLDDFDADERIAIVPPSHPLGLTRLDLSNTLISDDDVIALISAAPKLKTLDLSGCFTVSDRTLAAVAKYCPHLDALSLRMAERVSAYGIEAVTKNCRRLRVLSVGWTKGTLGCGPFIAEHCSNLEHLDLSGMSFEITDTLVKRITAKSPRLRSLDLSDCYNLTNLAIDHVCDQLECIEYVAMSRCHRITSDPMWRLAKIPTLKSLKLIGCYPEIVPDIKKACEHLTVNDPALFDPRQYMGEPQLSNPRYSALQVDTV
mmetsp:Transcript_37702/g.98759  ORF Transcript_37702/g.98759 Transcript_37702/m.98759 type:complete len:427 (-) Transcript_37702:290-1570(-)|eukprot:CAMPEP_0182917044 /NCGR_PEP_ID=MMETSP0105_2-20130417/1288_1 /TAXON_ID=81532 ORGANISM="Acanthoeca-like sp., Strain 10tr" /NCGR_SAMPLE_ID=MMETSP0105_2 /ASSEMBLY_ACC=CAM_ASM_000205 /LENGTH=426 /DNA_ID=CAMNT_0025054025 /DNA_START=108 /DNA_END=1388 /DNA_ORIENTATION=+